MVKKILSIVCWAITGVAVILLFVFGRKWYLETPLKGIVVNMERHHSNGFVERDSVLALAEALCDMEHHASISNVDLIKLRKELDKNPWIEWSNAHIGLNDTLTINIKEYEPIMRVYNTDQQSAYITAEGVMTPPSPHYTPRMIIASGNYVFKMTGKNNHVSDTLFRDSGLAETLTIAKAIQKDPFLNGNIGQIHRNNKKQYELTVNGLSAVVFVGDTLNIDTKLAKLGKLLEKYSGTEELNAYKNIDLQYKNQIVCTK